MAVLWFPQDAGVIAERLKAEKKVSQHFLVAHNPMMHVKCKKKKKKKKKDWVFIVLCLFLLLRKVTY